LNWIFRIICSTYNQCFISHHIFLQIFRWFSKFHGFFKVLNASLASSALKARASAREGTWDFRSTWRWRCPRGARSPGELWKFSLLSRVTLQLTMFWWCLIGGYSHYNHYNHRNAHTTLHTGFTGCSLPGCPLLSSTSKLGFKSSISISVQQEFPKHVRDPLVNSHFATEHLAIASRKPSRNPLRMLQQSSRAAPVLPVPPSPISFATLQPRSRPFHGDSIRQQNEDFTHQRVETVWGSQWIFNGDVPSGKHTKN
jgi:hypothetical protein